MKRLIIKSVFIILAAVLVLAAAFVWLDFQAISSHTQTDHQLSTYRAGEELPSTMQDSSVIEFSVSGDSALESALRSALRRKLDQDSSFGEVNIIAPLKEKVAHPTLQVELSERNVKWTPFYARTILTAKVVFASDGDVSFTGNSPVQFDSTNSPGVKAEGEYHLLDSSWGVMSLPGYNRHLAQKTADIVVDGLREVYQVK